MIEEWRQPMWRHVWHKPLGRIFELGASRSRGRALLIYRLSLGRD